MTVLLLALITLVFVGGQSGRAHASCNAIPEQPTLFRGERGSIDRPFISPDPDEIVTLRFIPDSEASPVPRLVAKDFLITIIFKPPAEAPLTFFIAGNDDCEPLEEPVCFLERLFCHAPRTCFTATAVGLHVTEKNGLPQLIFRLPEIAAAGPVTLAVTRRDNEGQFTPPIGLGTKTCADFLTAAAAPNLAVCIDQLRPPEVDPPGDPTFTQLVALAPSYDYSDVCTHNVDDPKCSGKADDVAFTVDTDGDVTMPVVWEKVLRTKSVPHEFYRRDLRASTAVEAVLGQGKRIIVPSAVFLQTTTQQGGGFSPSPVFIPTAAGDRPYEQTFSGTADKAKSVLKFARRKLWDHMCAGGANKDQACEPASASVDCPSAQCTQSISAPGEYFACVGGDRDRLPCTQTVQCPQGTCRRVSDAGSVCYAFTGKPISPSTACQQDSDCGKDAECGPGLFEFRNRKTNGVVTIKRRATKMSGVCDSGINEGNVCASAAACNSSFFGSVQCVTYRAEALQSSTTP